MTIENIARKYEERERIPSIWSYIEYYLKYVDTSESYCVVILRTTPDRSVGVKMDLAVKGTTHKSTRTDQRDPHSCVTNFID